METKINFYKTSITGICLSKSGSVKNTIKSRILKVSKRGYFTHLGKPINLPKLMLETFKGIKIKPGRINFIDKNEQNFKIENIEYVTKLDNVFKPSESLVIEIIKFYTCTNEKINVRDVFNYRMSLSFVLEQRDFFKVYRDWQNIDAFKDYFSIYMPSFKNLALRNKISINDSRRTIYLFLNKLIDDCRKDGIIKQ
ncbi:hypothetical protein GSF70_03485 [Flavobacteriaceae bacterium W22]|nr:hypothetical protein [Flavobacteriaceae bacterium W22]